MVVIQQILFVVVASVAAYVFFGRLMHIRRVILLGREENRYDRRASRWRAMLLIAFGQRKMFKRVIPALLHLTVYVGFIIINIEGVEFFLDGVTGRHRILAQWMQSTGHVGFYTLTLNLFEFLTVGVIAASAIFLIRRNILHVGRFSGEEMTRWPKLDANLILIFEIILMFAIMSMNAADQILQDRGVAGYPETGTLILSDAWASVVYKSFSTPWLVAVERLAWWIHIIGIFGFAVYITYSKHLHTFLAFPNTYFAKLDPPLQMANMPEVSREVDMMLGLQPDNGSANPDGDIPRLGAKDVRDLSWINLLGAFTCTECGRCTAVCPASITGKKLSPRKIMMDTRDRAEELGKEISKYGIGHDDGKTLLGEYISKEELYACTSCGACIEACPVSIDPLSVILQMRRYLSLEESAVPAEWTSMFSNIETAFNPWKFPFSERFAWAAEIASQRNDHDKKIMRDDK